MNLFDKILILDGAMGTELVKRNAPMGKIPEELNITHPEIIKEIHTSYLESGSGLIYTNTFGANAYKCKHSNYSVTEIVSAGVRNAKEAAAPYGALVGLSMGTIGDILEPFGNLKFDDAYEMYKEMITAGESAGADVLVFETQTDLLEVKAGVLAAKENSKLPIFVTMTFEQGGRTFTGTLVEAAAITLASLGVDAVGVNCSLGPEELLPFVKRMRDVTDIPIIVKPNAGLPDPVTNTYNLKAEDFAEQMKAFMEMGVSFVGGCCGTDPEYIRGLVNIRDEYKPVKSEKGKRPYLSSARAYVNITHVNVVGERINPTGKKKFQQALLDHDLDYVMNQALEQVGAGATVLDVNVCIPTVDEKALMIEVVKELQTMVDTPLQIDSSSVEAIEAALRIYNGKPIINSVNADDERLDAILPIAKKYGAAVVGLTLNEEGIPQKAEERVEMARHIVEKCDEYGIPRCDIYIDCLTQTVSIAENKAEDTLDAIRRVKSEFGVKTVLGVSNISFGLPTRAFLITPFLSLAMYAGLDLAIINPNNAAMMGAFDAFLTLSAVDPGGAAYAEKYAVIAAREKEQAALMKTVADAGAAALPAQASGDGLVPGTILYDVCKGLKDSTAEDVRKLLETKDPMEIINGELIPALDKVGEDFENHRSFLPQLLSSAKAAEAGFAVIKEHMAKNNVGEQISKGRIVICTVKGDVHDIGKNIVKTILENYGFSVLDLGKDVAPETVVETVKRENIKLVGLSALMTTTVASMEETIRQLRETGCDCKVFV
ncbi:MAG: homocysteine S-methyltransferase family protein, partial [Lachnospiraceae bacterium]|nr:homocysteine S-methyltransferase family protein [Lachnospiraceae bacterium]